MMAHLILWIWILASLLFIAMALYLNHEIPERQRIGPVADQNTQDNRYRWW